MATKVQDFLRSNPNYVGYANTANRTVTPPKQSGKGGFLSSIISELGGAGGAAGGAAIGTALLPGIGTLVGAGLGGFLGGTGGRLAENKIRDNEYKLGSALKEGALSGVLGAGGEAFQLAKAGKAITGSSRLLHPVENITAGIAEKTAGRTATGALEGLGKGLKANGLGLAQGATAPGMHGIGASTSDDLVKTIVKDFKIKPGSPEAVQRALEPKLTKLGEQLGARYTKSNVAVLPEELNKLGTNIIEKAVTQGGLDKTAENYALEQARRLTKAKDIKGLWQFTKDLEATSTSLGKGGTAATTSKNAVIDIIRQEVRPFLQDKVPGLATDNALYHKALDANKLLIKASRNSTGGSISGKVMSLAPIKSAESKLGTVLDATGRTIAGHGDTALGSAGSKVVNQLVRQAPASLSRAMGGAMQPQDATQTDQTMQDVGGVGVLTPDALYGAGALGGQTPQTPQGTMMQQAPQSAYSLQQAIADIQAAPDAKTQKAIMDYYDFVSNAEAAQNKTIGNTYNSTAAGVIADTTTGLQALQDLKSQIANSGANAPLVGKLRALNPYDTGAKILQSQIDTARQIVGKALEGGVLRKEDEVKYQKILPTIGDSDTVAQNKIDQLIYLISQRLDTYRNSINPNSSDLSSLIQGYGGQ